MKEERVRKRVKALKGFYMELTRFILANALFILIWLTFNRSETFWPKYILIVWGVALVIEACRKDIMPFFFSYLSFLTPEWEEERIKEILGNPHVQWKIRLKRDEKR